MEFVKSDWLDDWYCLNGCTKFGIPEGTGNEWLQIVESMEQREQHHSFKRVGFHRDESGWMNVYSPRNSFGSDDYYPIPPEEVGDFVRMIRNEVLKHREPTGDGAGI